MSFACVLPNEQAPEKTYICILPHITLLEIKNTGKNFISFSSPASFCEELRKWPIF